MLYRWAREEEEAEYVLTITNEIELRAQRPVVFDLLTTTQYWPHWHVSTRSVAGVTDRPYVLGEVIHEHAEMETERAIITWRCVAHDGPHSAALESSEHAARILYKLEDAGDHTLLARQLTVDPAMVRSVAPTDSAARELLWRISQQSLQRFQLLVHAMHPPRADAPA